MKLPRRKQRCDIDGCLEPKGHGPVKPFRTLPPSHRPATLNLAHQRKLHMDPWGQAVQDDEA